MASAGIFAGPGSPPTPEAARAVESLGASPAALTWRAGVDLMTLGFTKNGALAAGAVSQAPIDAVFGERRLFSRDGATFYQRAKRPPARLVPLGERATNEQDHERTREDRNSEQPAQARSSDQFDHSHYRRRYYRRVKCRC